MATNENDNVQNRKISYGNVFDWSFLPDRIESHHHCNFSMISFCHTGKIWCSFFHKVDNCQYDKSRCLTIKLTTLNLISILLVHIDAVGRIKVLNMIFHMTNLWNHIDVPSGFLDYSSNVHWSALDMVDKVQDDTVIDRYDHTQAPIVCHMFVHMNVESAMDHRMDRFPSHNNINNVLAFLSDRILCDILD